MLQVADELETTRVLCRKDFATFVREFWPSIPGCDSIPLEWNWHLDVLTSELQGMAERVFLHQPKTHDLVVNISPGTTKSSVVSILFPDWVWTRMPEARFICASHTAELVIDLAYRSREVIRSEKYRQFFPYIELKWDKEAKSNFGNTRGGSRLACTVGGKTPMGFHAHFVIPDDPIDPQGALSELELKNAKNFMTNVIPTRVVDKRVSVTILIMQRLHREDPTAVMLKVAEQEGTTPVKHFCIPAETKQNWEVKPESLRALYSHDGLMDPTRLPWSYLNDALIRLGPYGYSGQFGQSPTPAGGGMFKEIHFLQRCKAAPYHARRIRYWDRACLVGDTLVETSRGPVPIQKIRGGDYVLTRQGYKEVRRSGKTKEVDEIVTVLFSNGSMVTGTGDHRVWDDLNWDYVPLATLSGDCYTIDIRHSERGKQWDEDGILKRKRCSSTVSGTPDTGEVGIIGRMTTSRCTDRSGSFITGRSQPVIRFTTKMGTGTTTTFQILNPSLLNSTIRNTAFFGSTIRQRRGENIRRNLSRQDERRCGEGQCNHTSVFNAERYLGPNMLILSDLNSVPQSVALDTTRGRSRRLVSNVERDIGDARDRIVALSCVQTVADWLSARFAKRSSSESRWCRNAVPQTVEENLNGCVGVYDIEVEDAHEFFANGILVHNSTSQGGCATAGVLMAKDENGDIYVEDCVWGQWEPTERNRVMKATALKDRARYGPKNEPLIYVEAEGGSSGRDAWKGVVKALEGFRVLEDRPTGKKDVRAEPWSSQCAALNVYLVDNGESEGLGRSTWDISGYITEHTTFKPDSTSSLKRGNLVDRVDASSGAYNLLIGKSQAKGVFRVLSPGKKTKGLRILACSRNELQWLSLDVPSLLIDIVDPSPAGEEVMSAERRSERRDEGGTLTPAVDDAPIHGLNKLLASLSVSFADVAPVEVQERWGEPLEAYGKLPEEVVMKPEQGKKVWSLLLKKRDPPAQVWVIVDDGDRRALSVACALSDCLNLKRQETVQGVDDTCYAATGDDALNPHVLATMKASRMMVVG